MSASNPSSINIKTKSSFRKNRRELKRRTAKTARRVGKKLLEDTPKKVTRGWID